MVVCAFLDADAGMASGGALECVVVDLHWVEKGLPIMIVTWILYLLLQCCLLTEMHTIRNLADLEIGNS